MEDKRKIEYRVTRRVTVIGGVADSLLAVAKIVVGITAQSQALIADGIHSFSDLATDVIVVFAAKHAAREADIDHPYGHHRFETAASVLLALSLAMIAAGIMWASLQRVISDEPIPVPGILALLVALVSAGMKEAIYHYTIRAAKRINSKLLTANAWHSRSDALSSVVVMIGIIGAMLGFPVADAIAAAVVGAMILQIAWKIGIAGFEELTDKGLEPDELLAIENSAKKIPGVYDVHDLRTRRMGSGVFADLHVRVSPTISVSEGHRIGDEVTIFLKNTMKHLDDVVVHIDSEDDDHAQPSAQLPLRAEIESDVKEVLSGFPQDIGLDRLVLHYNYGKVLMEVWITSENADADQSVVEEVKQLLGQLPYVAEVELLRRY